MNQYPELLQNGAIHASNNPLHHRTDQVSNNLQSTIFILLPDANQDLYSINTIGLQPIRVLIGFAQITSAIQSRLRAVTSAYSACNALFSVGYKLIPGLFLLLSATALLAQKTNFKQYQQSDGLPSNKYNYHLLQDSKGYLWVSSQGGLCRFDGHSFKYYGLDAGLKDLIVLRSVEDHNHRIWVQSYQGFLSYVDGDSLIGFRYNDSIQHLLYRDFTWFFNWDTLGNLYLGHTIKGLWVLDTTGNLSNPIPYMEGREGIGLWWPSAGADPIAFRMLPSLITEVPQKLYLFDDDFQEMASFPVQYDPDQPNRRVSYALCKDGSIAITYGGDLFKVWKNGRCETLHQPVMHNSVFEDRDGTLWTSTFGYGLMGYPNGKITPDSSVADTTFFYCILPHKFFHTGLQDHEGGIWLGSFTNGVIYISDPFIWQNQVSATDPNLNTFYVIGEDQDRLFITASTKQIVTVIGDSIQVISLEDHFPGVTGGTFFRIVWDESSQRLYFSYRHRLLYFKEAEEYKQLHEVELPDGFGRIKALEHSKVDDFIWVSDGSKYLQLRETGYTQQSIVVPGGMIAMEEDEDGSLWIGNEKGLWHYDQDTLVHIEHDHPIVNSRITRLFIHRGNLWISNPNEGFAVLLKDSLVSFPQSEYGSITPHNYFGEADTVWACRGHKILQIVVPPNGSISMNSRIILSDKNSKLFDLSLIGNQFYATTTTGLIQFPRRLLHEEKIAPPVYITAVQLNDRDTTLLSHYELPHHHNRIRIRFGAISYHATTSQYRYRLTGLDTNWHLIDQPSTQFTELSPGNYTFEVYGLTNENTMSKQAASFSFVIHPAFWATWWFRSLGILVLITGIVAFFRLQLKRARRGLELEQQLLRLESKALRAQMNPHFIFNVLGAIQGFVSLGDTRASEAYLGKFASLIRIILENSRESVVSLSKELTTLQLYLDLEQARFVNGFNYQVEVDEALELESTYIPAMLIQPYLENAIIHGLSATGDAGRIDLQLKKQGKSVACEIRDYGNGTYLDPIKEEEANYHKPLGMLITRERLALLNQKLAAAYEVKITNFPQSSTAECGTLIQLTIPIHPQT